MTAPAPQRPEKKRRDLPPTPPDPMGGLPLIDTRDTPEAAPAGLPPVLRAPPWLATALSKNVRARVSNMARTVSVGAASM